MNSVYELIERGGLKVLTSKRIVTEKNKEGRRNYKVGLAERFEDGDEEINAKDAPTCSREKFKLVFTITGRNERKCISKDVKRAYFQGEEIKTVYL